MELDSSVKSVIIMIGSNIGDRKSNLDRAIVALHKHIDVTIVTDDIDNPDFTGQGPDYLNRLVTGRTQLPLNTLRRELKALEALLGRKKSDTNGLVAIDIDIVVYDGNIVKPSEYTSMPCRALLKSHNISLDSDNSPYIPAKNQN